jgi:hypothetical protein
MQRSVARSICFVFDDSCSWVSRFPIHANVQVISTLVVEAQTDRNSLAYDSFLIGKREQAQVVCKSDPH